MAASDWAVRGASSQTMKVPRLQGKQASEQQVGVGVGDAATEEDRRERAQQHERPERDRALAPCLADGQQYDAEQAAVEEAQERSYAELGPAEVAEGHA